jgi:catechol 2,3-dioxygenase-like lactoylglutathione lyase family enzyme
VNRRLLCALLGLCVLTNVCTAAAPTSAARDALAPTSSAKDALVSPLQRIVISTNSLAESLLFYRDGLGLSVDGPVKLSKHERNLRLRAWNVARNDAWQLYRLHRPGVLAAEIELVVFERIKPAIHRSWSALELGPLSIGFPNAGQLERDQAIRALGFGALNALEIYSVPRPDGTTYRIEETIFNGPDFVHAVGIHRADGQSQLGPLDMRGLGGPAYSAMVVADAGRMIAFMTDVLGWEMRVDRQWKSAGSKGALNVPDGTEFRFSILYAKGASSGHVLLMQYLNAPVQPSAAPAQVPNRGIGMWVMQTQRMSAIRANARKFGSPLVRLNANTARESLLLTAPNGFKILIEPPQQATSLKQ